MAYAENTTVTVDRSKTEIEKILARYGATGFMYGIRSNQAVIAFEANDRHVRFVLPMPDPADSSFRTTPTGLKRSPSSADAAFEQEIRRRWRALSLAIKAKLEVVETGIAEFDEEFLAHIVMPDGRNVGEHTIPAIDEAYRTGKVAGLLIEYQTQGNG